MKPLFENWRKFLNESWDEDIADIVADVEKREKAAKAGAGAWQPTVGAADWKKFKKWKEEEAQPPEEPEDFEKALKQKSSQKKGDILKFNCEAMKKDVFGGPSSILFRGEGAFDCQSLLDATQGTKPGEGSPSQIFKSAKFVKEIGSGAFGVAVLFDNDHIVKFFKGGVGAGKDPLLSELEGYEKLLSSQLIGTAKSYDLAVYEFGRIPVHTYKWVYRIDGADKVPVDGPPQYVGYAEIGKVIPFGNWVKDKYNENTAKEISEFIWEDLASGLDDAWRQKKVLTFDQVGGGAEEYIDYIMNGGSYQSKLDDLGIVSPVDPHAPTQPGSAHSDTQKQRAPRGADRSSWPTRSSKPDSATLAGRVAQRRARTLAHKHPKVNVETWLGIKNHGLSQVSKHVQKYGWAADRDDYFNLPAMPPALNYGLGKKFLYSLLISVYRAAKLSGDNYLYGNATSDVHEGNFGISYQTGEVIIFDR